MDQSLNVEVRTKRYAGAPVVLQDVRITLHPGEFVSLVGPSGVGKSTLMRIIAALDSDYDGVVRHDGAAVTGPGPKRGVVFQESRLLGWKRVAKNIEFALPRDMPGREKRSRVRNALELVRMAGTEDLWPYQLSGGMEKRVALARALVSLPRVLLMDEPFTGIDPLVRRELQDEVSQIHAREGLTTLLITHDVEEAVHLSDRILILSGRPATITHDVRVGAPRPRDRAELPILSLQQQVLRLLEQETPRAGIAAANYAAGGAQAGSLERTRDPGYPIVGHSPRRSA